MKTVVFMLVALLSAPAVLSFPAVVVEVPPQCVDPTYACQDLESARLCNVVKSCIHDIWSTMNAPDDDDDICQICKEMVKEARDQLLSNMTQEEIKEVFEGSCKLLPVKLVADACIKLVDEFIPQLVEMLASRMDPNMVCTVSGLCNLAHLPILEPYKTLLSAISNRHAFTDDCDHCTTVVSSVKKIVSAVPEDKLKKFINYIVTVAEVEYDKLRLHYVDSVYSFLTSTLDPKVVCSVSKACPSTCKVSNKLKDELTCEFCTNVLEHVKELVTANTTVEEFRTALYNFCNHTGSFSDRCKTLVDDYFDTMFQYIRTMDSKGVCTLIGLCNNDFCIHTPLVEVVPAVMAKKKFHAIKLLPSLSVGETENSQLQSHVEVSPHMVPSKKVGNSDESESNEIFGSSNGPLPVERFSHPSVVLYQKLDCEFCRALSFYIKNDLKMKKSINWQSVDDAFRNVCQKWSPDMLTYCKAIRDKYSSKMMHQILESGNFDGICVYAEACPPLKDEKTLVVTVKKPQNISGICELCKNACDAIVSQLKDPSLKKSVENALARICNYFPDSMRNDCHNFINDNVDNMFNILEQELDGDNICPALHLCPDTMRKITNVKDIECDLCKDFIRQIQQKLQDPDVKQSFKNILEKACAVLPEGLAKECKDFVDQNIDYLVKMICEDLDPNLICSALKICPGSTIRIPKKIGNLECDLCKEVIEKIDEDLEDHATEEEIKKALDKVCSYFPSSFAAKCEHFVNQYAAMLISILATEMDPTMVCAALNVCPANMTVVQSWKSKAKDIECEGCYYVFHYIQEQLMNGESQEELKTTLKHLCNLLPGVYGENCAAFIDEFGSSLLTLVAQELDPSNMCKDIGVCNTTRKTIKLMPVEKVKTVKLDTCSLCTTVVDSIDTLLEEDDIDQEITALVEKVCNVVPSSVKDKCSAMVETYGPYILQMIGQLANSTQVCQDIDLCPRVAGHVHLLGGKKCTFGPSYWCQSRVHASACKAELYCHEKVWRASGIPQ